MGQDTLYEVTRRQVPIVKYDKMFASWHNSVLAVRTNKGMNFFTYSHNLNCLDKKIDFIESSVETPKNSPAEKVCQAKFIKNQMKNMDFTDMILYPAFWPHNPQLVTEMASIVLSKWSPDSFFKNESVIALLNCMGGVHFYGLHNNTLKSILDLSPYIIESLDYNKSPADYKQLKEAVFTLETTSFCWAPTLNADGSCYFLTAQKNGCIIIWNILREMESLQMKGKLHTDIIIDVNRMLFIQLSGSRYWLVCADLLGQIQLLDLTLNKGEFKINETHSLWECKDKMNAKNLQYLIINEIVIFICSKHRHLLVQQLDKNCKITSQYLENINDYGITSISKSNNEIYLGTFNINIYKINIDVINNKLDVNLTPLEFKDNYATHELHSLSFSRNNVICALTVIDRRVLCRKESYKIEIVFLTTESLLESLIPTLVNNPSKKLTYYWDCIEMLRYKIMKTKTMPVLNYHELYTANQNDPYMLKIYLILLSINKNIEITTTSDFPESSIENVKERILLLHAKSLVQDIYKKYKKNKTLKDIEKECLYGCKKYFAYYSNKHKESVESSENIKELLIDNIVYTCQCCDAELSGFTCKHGHLNMLCMLSLTPLDDDYLVCKSCRSIARINFVDRPLCVFCDLYLLKEY